jgi:hypothetical protein
MLLYVCAHVHAPLACSFFSFALWRFSAFLELGPVEALLPAEVSWAPEVEGGAALWSSRLNSFVLMSAVWCSFISF